MAYREVSAGLDVDIDYEAADKTEIDMLNSSIDLQPMLEVEAPVAPSNNRRKKWLMGGLTVLLIAAAATIGVVIGRSTAGSSEATPVLQNGMVFPVSEGMAYREVSAGLDVDIDYEAADKTEIDMLKISKSGSTEVYGRIIDWKTRLYTKGLKVRYSATATDRATGIQGSSSNHKSGKGATEAAVKQCFEKLAAGGLLHPAQLEGAINAISIPEVNDNEVAVEAESDDVEVDVSELLKISKSGTTTVHGRQIKWKASAYLKGLKLRYKATATDKQSGISGSSSGHKSGKGATEAAVKQCFEKMIAAGVIPMPQAALEISTDVDAEFPMDNSEADIAEELEEQDLLKISKSGTEIVAGRTIDWKTRLYTKGFKVRYSATATDRATGIQGSSSNHKSGKGATESAVKQCFEKLAAAGYLQAPQGLTAITAPELIDNEEDVPAIVEEESDEQPILKISKSGTEVVYGRSIAWKSTLYLKGLKIRYKATATDKQSGIKGSSSGHKSGKGSVEAAVKDCFQKLIAAGIVKP